MLALQMEAAASVSSRDSITERYQGIVRPIALRIKSNLPASIELEDLIQIGLLTVWLEADKYQPRRAATFPYYIRLRVRGAMLDAIKGREFREATHDELDLERLQLADGRRTVEERTIAREELRGVQRAHQAEMKRVADAMADPDTKNHPLSKRQQKVIKLRYAGAGMTQKAAGRKLKISQAASRELELRALRNLKRKLAA